MKIILESLCPYSWFPTQQIVAPKVPMNMPKCKTDRLDSICNNSWLRRVERWIKHLSHASFNVSCTTKYENKKYHT